MPSSPTHGRRRSNRTVTKKRASLVITLRGVQKMFPCLVVDRSQEGLRVKGNFRLRRGQLVEIVLDDPVDSLRCVVVWTGTTELGQVGEGGLQRVANGLGGG